MSNLSTLPKGDSAWLLRKAIERIIQQVSVLETNIGASTSGNSANTQIIFNDNGTLRGDAGLVYNKTTDALTVGGNVQAASATITGDLTVDTNVLKVDTTLNRVGIGTASPIAGSSLDVRGAVGTGTDIQSLTLIDTSALAINNGGGLSFGYVFESPSTVIGRAGYIKTIKENATDGNYASAMVFGVTANGASTAERYRIGSDGTSTWSVAGTTAMTLNSTGLGIGATTPAYKLEVATGTSGQQALASFRTADTTAANNAGIQIYATPSSTAASRSVLLLLDADGADASGGDYFFIQKLGNSGQVDLYQQSNAAMTFSTNGTERYRIASDGVATWSNVGGVAGTAMTLNSTVLAMGVTPAPWATIKAIQVGAGASLFGYTATEAALTGNTYYNGGLRYVGNGEASQYQQQVGEHRWFSAVNNTAGAGASITFGAAKMTLDASGKLNLGVASPYNGARLTVQSAGGAGAVSVAIQNDDDSYYAINFRNSSGTSCGSISCATSLTAYNTSSDYRLKESVQPLTGGLTRVNALKPSIYKWKVDGKSGEGFIAHELAETVPLAVTGEKDAVDADNKPTYQGVDLSKLVPILVAAIQELTARVQTLEAR